MFEQKNILQKGISYAPDNLKMSPIPKVIDCQKNTPLHFLECSVFVYLSAMFGNRNKNDVNFTLTGMQRKLDLLIRSSYIY